MSPEGSVQCRPGKLRLKHRVAHLLTMLHWQFFLESLDLFICLYVRMKKKTNLTNHLCAIITILRRKNTIVMEQNKKKHNQCDNDF